VNEWEYSWKDYGIYNQLVININDENIWDNDWDIPSGVMKRAGWKVPEHSMEVPS